MKYFYQFTVNSAPEAAHFEAYLLGMGYEVTVGGPFEIAMFDLKDISPGAVMRAENAWVVSGEREVE